VRQGLLSASATPPTPHNLVLWLCGDDLKIASFEQLQSAWHSLMAEYKKQAKGPASYTEFFRASESLFDPARLVMEIEIEEAEEKSTLS